MGRKKIGTMRSQTALVLWCVLACTILSVGARSLRRHHTAMQPQLEEIEADSPTVDPTATAEPESLSPVEEDSDGERRTEGGGAAAEAPEAEPEASATDEFVVSDDLAAANTRTGSAEVGPCEAKVYTHLFVNVFFQHDICKAGEEATLCAQAGTEVGAGCTHSGPACMAAIGSWCTKKASAERLAQESAEPAASNECTMKVVVKFLLSSSADACALSAEGERGDALVKGLVESRHCEGRDEEVRQAIKEARLEGCVEQVPNQEPRQAVAPQVPEVEVDGPINCNPESLNTFLMALDNICTASDGENCANPRLANCDAALNCEKVSANAKLARQCDKCEKEAATTFLHTIGTVCKEKAEAWCATGGLLQFECSEATCVKLLEKVQGEPNRCTCRKAAVEEALAGLGAAVCTKTAEEHCGNNGSLDALNCSVEECIEVATGVMGSQNCEGLCDFEGLAEWWEVKSGVCLLSSSEGCAKHTDDMKAMKCTLKDCVTSLDQVRKEKKCMGSTQVIAVTPVQQTPGKVAEESAVVEREVEVSNGCNKEGLKAKAERSLLLCEPDLSELESTMTTEFNCHESATLAVLEGLRERMCSNGKLVAGKQCEIDNMIRSLKTKNALCEPDGPKLICERVMAQYHCGITDCVGAISAERVTSCQRSAVEVDVLPTTSPVLDVDAELRAGHCDPTALFNTIVARKNLCNAEFSAYCSTWSSNLQGCSEEVCAKVLRNVRSVECPEAVDPGVSAGKEEGAGKVSVSDVEETMVLPGKDGEAKILNGDSAAAEEDPRDTKAVLEAAGEPTGDKPQAAAAAAGALLPTDLPCATMEAAAYGQYVKGVCKAKPDAAAGEPGIAKVCQQICAGGAEFGVCVGAVEGLLANCADVKAAGI